MECAGREWLLESCRYQMIFDMMSVGLEYKQRCELLMDWLETALGLFPDCAAVWIKPAGKLFTADQVRNHRIPGEDRFSVFRRERPVFQHPGHGRPGGGHAGDVRDWLPDVQYHFHGLDPDAVVNHALQRGLVPVRQECAHQERRDGGRPSGRADEPGGPGKCQYEEALIQPVRCVLDVCAGEYASGGRS